MYKRAVVASLLIAALCCAPGLAAQITRSAYFLRSTIETYPEAERRPILTFLDHARPVADSATREIVAGREAGVFEQVQATAKSVGQTVDSTGVVEMLHASYGSMGSIEFRSQAIVAFGDKPDVHDLTKACAATYYAVRSTKYPDEGLYLEILTLQLNGQPRLMSVRFMTYWTNVPPWLKPAEKAKP